MALTKFNVKCKRCGSRRVAIIDYRSEGDKEIRFVCNNCGNQEVVKL